MVRVLVLMGSVFAFMGMGPRVPHVCMLMSMCMKVLVTMQVAVFVGMREIPMPMFVRMRVSMRM